MMKKILNLKLLSLFVAMFVCGGLYAQGIKDIRINEVLVKNSNSLVDEYGDNSSWIELHNTGYSSVNIAGAQLSTKIGDKTRTYKIPKNDPRTVIAPQGYALFYATGDSEKGTFYTNFKLEDASTIYLLDASRTGVEVDVFKFEPSSLKEDVSIGWFKNHDNDTESVVELARKSPGSANNTENVTSRADKFQERDPAGFAMVLTAMSVVFMALVLLFSVFKTTGKLMVKYTKRKERKAKEAHAKANNKPVVHTPANQDGVPGAVIAAISLALKQYEEDIHDMESTVITINKVARTYSPWSSKIYGTHNQPIRK